MRGVPRTTYLLLLGTVLAGCTSAWDNALSSAKKASAPVGVGIGRAAPDIEGDDSDGKSFKLSDYRGKVVMLDFWGNW